MAPSDITAENYNKIEPFWPTSARSRAYYADSRRLRSYQGSSHTLTIEARDASTNALLPTANPATYEVTNQAQTQTLSGTIAQTTVLSITPGTWTITVDHSTYVFERWSDNNTQNPRTFSLDADMTLVALFDTGGVSSSPPPTTQPPSGSPPPTTQPPSGSPPPSSSGPPPGAIPAEVVIGVGLVGGALVFFAKDIADLFKGFGI